MVKMIFVLISLFYSSFLFSFTTKKVYDEANKGEYYRTKGNIVPSQKLAYEGIKELDVNLVKYLRQNRDPFYFILVEFRGNGLFLLEESKSLTLIIDGRPYSYNLYQKPKIVQLPKFSEETGWYKIQDGLPFMLAEAKEVKIKLKGKIITLEENLTKENLDVFKYFLYTYILKEQQRKEFKLNKYHVPKN